MEVLVLNQWYRASNSLSVAAHIQLMDKNHILLSEDLDYTDQNGNVDGKYGRVNSALVPVGISLAMTDISGASYSYNQDTDFEQFRYLEFQVMNSSLATCATSRIQQMEM